MKWDIFIHGQPYFLLLATVNCSNSFSEHASRGSEPTFIARRRIFKNRVSSQWDKKTAVAPDWPFHNFAASKSGYRLIFCRWETSCDEIWSSKNVNGSVGLLDMLQIFIVFRLCNFFFLTCLFKEFFLSLLYFFEGFLDPLLRPEDLDHRRHPLHGRPPLPPHPRGRLRGLDSETEQHPRGGQRGVRVPALIPRGCGEETQNAF